MKPVIFLLVFFLAILKSEAQEVTFLKLKQAFKYENNKKVPEFSGLCIKDGVLYSVNDKNENYLYQLEIDTIHSTFKANGVCISKDHDFEGICYYNNAFFAVDEKYCKVYKIVNHTAVEYSKEFLKSLYSRKLIDRGDGGNKQVEGFAMLNDSSFLIATERDITTLAKISIQGDILSEKKFHPLHFSDTCLPAALAKKSNAIKGANSFSDLCVFEGKAFLLERTKKMIHEIDISNDSFTITRTLSFKNGILPCEEYHTYYGAAEGLAIDDHYIYIILDNNQCIEKDKRGTCDNKGLCDDTRRTLFQFYKDNHFPGKNTNR